MAILTSEAIVLSTTKLRETSLITTFLTRDYGKIKTISKGVRKEGSALPVLYEPFTQVQIVFYEKQRSEIYFLSESSLIRYFHGLRSDLDKIAWASFLIELVDILIPLREKNTTLFIMLSEVLKHLEHNPASPVIAAFTVRLLWGSGSFPFIDPEQLRGIGPVERVYLNFEDGDLTTQDSPRAGTAYPVSKSLLDTICFLMENDFEKSLLLKIPREVESRLYRLIRGWVSYRYEQDLDTFRFLEELQII